MESDFDDRILTELYEVSETVYYTVINHYIADTPNIISELQEAIADVDNEKLREYAHKLRGSSSAVGLNEVSHLAFELEQMGRDGNVDKSSEAIPGLLTALEDAYKWLEGLRSVPPV